ncbi:MAG: glycoside hydrolase family 3 C-terminal domain-containing protein [Mariniphaga sp.]
MKKAKRRYKMIVKNVTEVRALYKEAYDNGWVLPCICTENLTTTEAILSAAHDFGKEKGIKNIPIIIAITCNYSHRAQAPNYTHTRDYKTGLKLFVNDIKALADKGCIYEDLQVMLHLDHIQFDDDLELLNSDLANYSSIMYDASALPFSENIKKTAEFVLKNKDNILPLNKNIKTIAVVGPNANDSTMLWANYNGFPSKTITILQGIKNKATHTKIIYEKGCDHVGDVNINNQSVAVSKVKDADLIIFVGGISPRLEGEEMPVAYEGFKGGDRTNIELPNVQKEMIKALKKTGKPIVYVVCTGSALALNWEQENANAIVNAWYGGQAAGTAVADILFGDYNPAGRLPVTFYKSIDQVPDFEDYSMKGRTYRYMTKEPLYPFGFGLSYTNFDYKTASISKPIIGKDEKVTLSVEVKNGGKRVGDEVIQVYLRNPNDPGAPIKALIGFKRVSLKPGELQKVSFVLEPKMFYSFNDNTQKQEVLAGKYELMYGGSSADKSLQKIELTIN